MPAPHVGLREFARILIISLPLVANAADDPSEIGVVDKVESEANIVSGDNATAVIIGTPVHMRDELRTGAQGRLKIRFRDETVLTLGEKASVVIDRYVYDPDRQVGETILQATKGAFRCASGRIKAMKQRVRSPSQLRSPISAFAAPSSGAARSKDNMGCCCSKV